jgi:hypothetical protein
MSRNNKNVAKVYSIVTSDWCVMIEQINEIGISYGLVQSILKDLSTLCDVFVCARVHSCILIEDQMEIRKVSSVEVFERSVQVADLLS